MCCDNIHPAICLQLICEGIYLLHSRIKRHRVRFFPVFVGYLIRKVLRKGHLALFFLSGPVLTAFMDGRVRDFHTFMKTRFILQILYKNATQYLQYLRIIDKKSEVIENKLHQSQKNEELIELLELQKSLVYFTTSLRSNEVVLEKLLRIDKIKKYPEDTDLLEDVIVENKQAMEMTSIYNGILSGTMDTFASVISNNLNIVMKFLATVTIVMSIPTMVASFYGMNVRASGMPFAEHPYGFGIVLFFTLVLTLIVAYIFNKKDLF